MTNESCEEEDGSEWIFILVCLWNMKRTFYWWYICLYTVNSFITSPINKKSRKLFVWEYFRHFLKKSLKKIFEVFYTVKKALATYIYQLLDTNCGPPWPAGIPQKKPHLHIFHFSLTMALYVVSTKSERSLKITYPAERPNRVQLGELKMSDLNTETPVG